MSAELSSEAKEVMAFMLSSLAEFQSRDICPVLTVRSMAMGHTWIVGVPGDHRSILSSRKVLPELVKLELVLIDRSWRIHPDVEKASLYLCEGAEVATC